MVSVCEKGMGDGSHESDSAPRDARPCGVSTATRTKGDRGRTAQPSAEKSADGAWPTDVRFRFARQAPSVVGRKPLRAITAPKSLARKACVEGVPPARVCSAPRLYSVVTEQAAPHLDRVCALRPVRLSHFGPWRGSDSHEDDPRHPVASVLVLQRPSPARGSVSVLPRPSPAPRGGDHNSFPKPNAVGTFGPECRGSSLLEKNMFSRLASCCALHSLGRRRFSAVAKAFHFRRRQRLQCRSKTAPQEKIQARGDAIQATTGQITGRGSGYGRIADGRTKGTRAPYCISPWIWGPGLVAEAPGRRHGAAGSHCAVALQAATWNWTYRHPPRPSRHCS